MGGRVRVWDPDRLLRGFLWLPRFLCLRHLASELVTRKTPISCLSLTLPLSFSSVSQLLFPWQSYQVVTFRPEFLSQKGQPETQR